MKRSPSRGLSLIDVVVGSALFALIFLALIGLMRSSLLIASLAKAKAGATAVANTQAEYIRSLPYDSVGTVGGIPAGDISEYSTTTANGIAYGVRTFVQYVDDPADGEGGSDENGITTDYKRIKVEVRYTLRGVPRTVDVVSNYAPPGIETSTGGGTLRVVIVDAGGVAVPGATVHIVNDSTDPLVDLTTFSDASGIVLLGGAATSTEYQVYVSKDGYSSAQTYERDTTNQNPTPGYLTVVKDVTTTGTFAIDVLGTITISTFTPVQATSTLDTFADTSLLASLTSTQVTGGSLTLSGNAVSGYASNGSATGVDVAPEYLVEWSSASTTLSVPANTDARVHVVDGLGILLSDTDLPGNGAGFNGTSIDLSGISTSTYPSLALVATFSTSDASTTPSLAQWALNALVGPIPEPDVSFDLRGTKVVGSTGGGTPIYKTTLSTATGADGTVVSSLEWDSYELTVDGYDVVEACSAPAYALAPGATLSGSLIVDTETANSVLISVVDSTGTYIQGATVTLSRTGFSDSVTTSSCGTAYFGGLTSASDYSVEISKSGYTTTTSSGFDISGQVFYATSFP